MGALAGDTCLSEQWIKHARSIGARGDAARAIEEPS